MKWFYFIAFLTFVTSCSIENSYTVTKVINGNSILISNGVQVSLYNVENSQENKAILNRYLQGKLLIYDKNNFPISKFTSDKVDAIVYNSDGDCINDLLSDIFHISKDEPITIDDPINESRSFRVKFSTSGGVLTIPIQINGEQMHFIFDTGASLISISITEASRLYNKGKLTESDFIGKSNFIDANGDITEGTIVNLNSVVIGNRELKNVQACIIYGQNAPLLLGQSALQKFGKVSIDYNKNEIIFE
ncbi:MAG TPA: retropepsin-like aspartic protease [Bacteroidales bacterium]|nr:retropepsin-like aspartic protease [Bacteroidales bacterium]